MFWISPYIVPWLFIAIVMIVVWRATRDYYLNYVKVTTKLYTRALIGRLSAAFVACNVVILVVSFMCSAGRSGSFDQLRTGSYAQAAAEFGLQAGQRYPLAIGDSLYGSVAGDVSTTAGLFTATSAIDLRPATSVTLNFARGTDAWTTTISTELIQWHTDQSAEEQPAMAILFKPGGYGSSSLWDNETEGTIALSNGALGYVSWFTHADTSLNDAGWSAGLAPVVNRGASRVDIWLSPELYKQITGQS
ncbi:MAG: hypothetical protein WBP12_02250 [Candidatus Saccharimonas sp.]